MALVSFQVIDGVDKGKSFENLETPVTLGREEGNMIRLNDERVSRFHAKIQEDHGQVVLTDLDSTNGSSVNGEPVQLRILRPGDQISVGRSKMVYGTPAQIAAVLASSKSNSATGAVANAATVLGHEVNPTTEFAPPETDPPVGDVLTRAYPKLPSRLTPSQAAQLSEVIDFFHRSLADATDAVQIPANGMEARLPLASWQRIQAVVAVLARYSREVAEPNEMNRVCET